MAWTDLLLAGHSWLYWLSWLWAASGLVLIVWIVLQQRSPVATLAWIISLAALPVVGLAIYAYFGPQRVKRQRLKRWRTRAALMSDQDSAILQRDRPEPPGWAQRHAQLIQASCRLPLCSTWSPELLASGGATFAALQQHMREAKDHIHLEYYTFEPDQTGQAILETLTARAAAGIRVRLLVDAIGSARLLSRRHRHLLQPLRQAGAEIAVFHPRKLDRLRPLVNLRTHRKIAVIDGRIGLLGGINITDAQNDAVRPRRAWRDTHLKLHGSAVRWLQYIFLLDWHYASGRQPAQDERILPDDEPAGDVAMQLVASGPDSDSEAIHRAVIDALGMARQRIWLSTAYFVPTEPAMTALTNAALRGVEVKIILPQRSDSRFVSAAARSYYRELKDAGVQVHEYTGRMFHAKTLLVDDGYSMIGSANFDNRSFRLNFEVAAVLYDRNMNAQLAALFETDLACSTLVPTYRRVPYYQQLFEAVARLASPLL